MSWIQVVLAIGMPFALSAQPAGPPYRFLVGAESEDQVALVEFRPCASDQRAPACGAVVKRTYDVGILPTEIEGPHGVVASRDGRSFYVTMAHGRPFGSLLRYDIDTGKRTGNTELGMFPATIDIDNATHLLYAINFNFDDPEMRPSSLSVVDAETMEEVARTTTCRMPHGSRLSPDHTRHYSACMMDDLLVEVDTRTMKVARRLPVGMGCSPTWAQPTVDGKTVWVACNKTGELVAVDVSSWTMKTRVKSPAAPYNMAVTPDGALLVVTQKGPGTTTVWRLSDNTKLAEIPGSRGVASSVAVSGDSRYAFVTLEGKNADPGTVDIIDLRALQKVASVDVGKQAGGIAMLPFPSS